MRDIAIALRMTSDLTDMMAVKDVPSEEQEPDSRVGKTQAGA